MFSVLSKKTYKKGKKKGGYNEKIFNAGFPGDIPYGFIASL
jgi:hypothetical protein